MWMLLLAIAVRTPLPIVHFDAGVVRFGLVGKISWLFSKLAWASDPPIPQPQSLSALFADHVHAAHALHVGHAFVSIMLIPAYVDTQPYCRGISPFCSRNQPQFSLRLTIWILGVGARGSFALKGSLPGVILANKRAAVRLTDRSLLVEEE